MPIFIRIRYQEKDVKPAMDGSVSAGVIDFTVPVY